MGSRLRTERERGMCKVHRNCMLLDCANCSESGILTKLSCCVLGGGKGNFGAVGSAAAEQKARQTRAAIRED